MALRLRGFTRAQERALRRSRAGIERRLTHPPCPIPHDLRDALTAALFAARPIVDLAYGGGSGGSGTPYARSAGYRILLYQRAFTVEKAVGSRLTAVLFHELVHIARGWELDAEAFENGCFTRAEGARPPTRDDWALFKGQRYQGWWVRVDPRTRRVTDYADRSIVTFPAPLSRSS